MDVIHMEEEIFYKKSVRLLQPLKRIPNYNDVKSFSGSVFETCVKISKSLISVSKITDDLGGQPTHEVFEIK